MQRKIPRPLKSSSDPSQLPLVFMFTFPTTVSLWADIAGQTLLASWALNTSSVLSFQDPCISSSFTVIFSYSWCARHTEFIHIWLFISSDISSLTNPSRTAPMVAWYSVFSCVYFLSCLLAKFKLLTARSFIQFSILKQCLEEQLTLKILNLY